MTRGDVWMRRCLLILRDAGCLDDQNRAVDAQGQLENVAIVIGAEDSVRWAMEAIATRSEAERKLVEEGALATKH